MPPALRRPRLRSCLLALLLLVLAPAALGSGARPASGEPAEMALANALGPSHESALVVKVFHNARSTSAVREPGRSRILLPLLFLVGVLALLLGLHALARPFFLHPPGGSLRERLLPGPSGPRAPPVLRLS